MKSMSRCLFVVVLSLAATFVHATVTDDLVATRASRTDPVTPGVWHADLAKARAYAEANGLPLIAVWSNGDFCQHCLVWEGVATAPLFREWMKSSGIVFYFGYVKDGYLNAAGDFGGGPSSDGKEGYHGESFYWCCNNQNATMAWPYVRFYWPKGGVDMAVTGSATDGEYLVKGGLPCMVTDSVLTSSAASAALYAPWVAVGDYGTYNPGARVWLDYVTNKDTGVLRNFSATPAYAGGAFDVLSSSEAPRACLQVEKGSLLEYVSVPLVRKETAIRAYAATNYVVCTYPSGVVKTNSVEWVVKQKAAEMQLKISPEWLESTSASPSIKMELYDQDMVKKSVCRVAVVDPVANTPANPLWIGERTVEGLSWGEWTMDIDTATQKVSLAKGSAYTLALVGGSLWCPDCYALDEYLIDKNEFHDWATNRHVACVAVDVPIFAYNMDYPTLLSHAKYDSGTYGTVSGSGWLSRHAVPLSGNGGTNAAEVLSRNLKYINNDTAHGGLCLPEPSGSTARKAGAWKTGVPGIVLLRADGTCAGRIYQFSNDGRTRLKNIPVATLVRRLDELIAQDEELGEEDNDSVKTTSATISGRNRKGINATLSFTDQADYYKIGATVGTDISFDLSAPAYSNLVIAVVDGTLADPDLVPVVMATNVTGSVKVRCSLPSSDCYVKIAYPLDDGGYPKDDFFALDNGGSTLCRYNLASDSVFAAQETWWEQEISDGEPEVTISLSKGQAYKFSGLDLASVRNADALVYDDVSGLWTAKVSGATTLDLAPDGGGKLLFGFQKWNPGTVAFVRSAGMVREKDGDYDYQIGVTRVGGLSGAARVKVSLADTSMVDPEVAISVYAWLGDRELEWLEGSNDVKMVSVKILGNKFADGNQWLLFSLNPADVVGDAAVSDEQFKLTIEDDDAKIAGHLAMTAIAYGDDASAGFVPIPANRRIVAKGGTKLTVGVDRLGGSTGMLLATLSTGGCESALEWISRDTTRKTATFALPEYVEGGGNRLTMTLVGLDGTVVDPAAKHLTIVTVPDTAAEFEVTSVGLDGIRNVAFGTRFVKVKADSLVSADVSKVSVAKIAGALAPGLSWAFVPDEGEAGVVSIFGTPTRAGAFAATFQVSEDGVAGGTVTIEIFVSDPSTPEDDDTPAVNPYLTTTRTLQNVMVVSNDCLVGILSVTIPPSGRLSAKYRPFSGNAVSLLSTSWSDCDEGDYTAELDPVTEDAADYGLTVTARADGTIVAMLVETGETLKCIVPTDSWSAKNPATDWKGYYTVSMPVESALTATSPLASGAGYVTFRMSASQAVNAGKMTYAGVLPNGRAFSGMSVLSDCGSHDAILPVVWGSGADRFSAIFVLNQTADRYRMVWPHSSVAAHWRHNEAGAESASYEAKLGVYGTLYTTDDLNMESCCLDTFNTQYLTFFAEVDKLSLAGFERGAPMAWVTNSTTVWVRQKDGSTKISLYDRNAALEDNGLSMSFGLSSGIVSGSLRIDFAASSVMAKFRGVVLPGWGIGEGCAGCTDSDATKRPFISGACWFNDSFEKAAVRRGCPFSIGVEPGK